MSHALGVCWPAVCVSCAHVHKRGGCAGVRRFCASCSQQVLARAHSGTTKEASFFFLRLIQRPSGVDDGQNGHGCLVIVHVPPTRRCTYLQREERKRAGDGDGDGGVWPLGWRPGSGGCARASGIRWWWWVGETGACDTSGLLLVPHQSGDGL